MLPTSAQTRMLLDKEFLVYGCNYVHYGIQIFLEYRKQKLNKKFRGKIWKSVYSHGNPVLVYLSFTFDSLCHKRRKI